MTPKNKHVRYIKEVLIYDVKLHAGVKKKKTAQNAQWTLGLRAWCPLNVFNVDVTAWRHRMAVLMVYEVVL